MTSKEAILADTAHRIATHRSFARLLQWGREFEGQEVAQGRRVIWAPCHALGRSLSLRAWIIEQASSTLGNSAPADAPTLLSGAADSLIVADPSVADRESLTWLAEMLACSEEVKGLTAAPPLPRLVVLLPVRGGTSDAVNDFANRLYALGSEEEKLAGREADPDAIEIDGLLRGLGLKNQEFLAAVSLAPIPLSREEYRAIAAETKTSREECEALLNSPLYVEVGGHMVPSCGEVRERIRAPLAPEALTRGAKLLLRVCEERLETLPDAAIELHARSGDQKQAAKLAKRRVGDHEASGRFSEAQRIMRQAREQGFMVEQGVLEVDEAHTAALSAEVGDTMIARELVRPLIRRRNVYSHPDFIEWLALALRTLAIKEGYEPKLADSLMRRAIRMDKANIDKKVRLTVLRVALLRSPAFSLGERADWLLTHINNATLAKVSPATLALYLLETGRHLVNEGHFKGAFKRLRRMISIATSDQQLAEALLLMARCRQHFRDAEGASRFASGALQYGLRCASLTLVREAAKQLRDGAAKAAQEQKPRKKDKASRPRLALSEVVAPRVMAQPQQMFEIMKTRFGISRWVRRRGMRMDTFGATDGAKRENTVVYEAIDGKIRCLTHEAAAKHIDALVLLRNDGDDLVQFPAGNSQEFTEESIVRFLLGDAESVPVADAVPPSRKNVVDEYMRRLAGQPADRGLHKAIESLFNKDLLMYLEDQGFNKEDMAAHLGVSRATLYRMYARAGLN